MSVDGAALEAPQYSEQAGFADSVTIAFGDLAADVYGIARVGLSGPDGARQASGLALLFSGGAPIAVQAQGGIEAGSAWGDAAAAGVRHDVVEPLSSWRMSFAADDSQSGFTIDISALTEPAVLDPGSDAAKLGGMQGYEQLVRVDGEAVIAGKKRKLGALGQRGHSWGAPDWSGISMARTVCTWLADKSAVTITSLRRDREDGHDHDASSAFWLRDGTATPIADPRVSTTFDNEGRQRSAGLELYVNEKDDFPHRAAGEVICGTTLDLGRLRMDTAFMRWRMEGREGVGRYDVVRRVG